jgi:hypothetical protein
MWESHSQRSNFIREVDVPNREVSRVIVCSLAAAIVFWNVGSVAAKARPTYDQAWALCTKQLNRAGVAKDSSARYSAGAACMHKYGYRI